jgi:uncharacterized protein YycO
MKTWLSIPASFLVLVALSCTSGDFQLREGDIIFQTSLSPQSQAIQRATQSSWNHMGIILTHNGRQMVFEAADVVKFTPMNVWVKRGKDDLFVVKRLKNADAVLTPFALEKLQTLAARFERKPYDAQFGWGDEMVYCSELVWKMYERALGIEVGPLQKLGDFHIEDTMVRARLVERYGEAIPLNETVISPEQIYRSQLLETVYERN